MVRGAKVSSLSEGGQEPHFPEGILRNGLTTTLSAFPTLSLHLLLPGDSAPWPASRRPPGHVSCPGSPESSSQMSLQLLAAASCPQGGAGRPLGEQGACGGQVGSGMTRGRMRERPAAPTSCARGDEDLGRELRWHGILSSRAEFPGSVAPGLLCPSLHPACSVSVD